MPLLNVDWENSGHQPLSFLNQWSCRVSDALNAQMPKGEDRFVIGPECVPRLKTTESVAGFDHGPPSVCVDGRETGEKYPAFDPTAPTLLAPARFADRVGVTVVDRLDLPGPAAAVLFVTPDNKADSDAALAFAVRAAGFMSAGAGVVIVDALPGPPAWATHLHSLTGVYPIARRPRNGDASVLVVHPTVQNGGEWFAVWHHAIPSGAPLPTVPVPVRGSMHLRLDLEATYAEACERGRVE